jgi:hypothetical protein
MEMSAIRGTYVNRVQHIGFRDDQGMKMTNVLVTQETALNRASL